MDTKINTDEVSAVLTSFGAMMRARKDLVKGDGTLDVVRVRETEEAREAIESLIALGVKNSNELADLGFVAGAMLLPFESMEQAHPNEREDA